MDVIEFNVFSYFWLPPLIWHMLIGLAGLLVSIGINKLLLPAKEENIAILGTEQSGKTTLWNRICQGGIQCGQTIGANEVPEKIVTINGIERRIKQSVDIAGGEEMVGRYYQELIEKNDMIIFLFDIQKFLEDQDVTDDVKMRLKKIHNHMNEERTFHVVGTHIDLLAKTVFDRKRVKDQVVKRFTPQFLKNINCTEDNLALLNFIDEKEIDAYINGVLFKNQKG